MYCLNCGTNLADTARFCHVCGAPTKRATPPLPPAPPPAPAARGESTPRRGTRRLLGCGAALLGVLLLVGLGLLAAYFLLGLHKDSGIAELAPDDAAAVVVIRPGLLQLNRLRDTDRLMGAAAALAPLAAAPGVADFAFNVYGDYGEMLQNADINPVEDVMPWIGREVALAVTDPGTEAVVVAAAVRNEAAAADFLAGLREHLEDEGIEFDEGDHRGVTVTEIVGPEFHEPLAYAVAGGRLLLASDRETLEDALDRAGGGPSLADNDAYREAMASQPGNRLGAVYIDPAALGNAEALDALRWIAGSASLASNGLRFGYQLGLDLDRLDNAPREWLERGGVDNALAARVPRDTLLYLAGGSLADAVDSAAAQSPDFEDTLRGIRRDDQTSGLYNLLQMMTGEFALAVSRDNEGLVAELTGEPFGLLVVSETGDGEDAAAELDDIFDDMAREMGVDHETDRAGGATIGYLEDSFAGRFLSYGVDGDEMAIATSDVLVEEALAAEGGLAGASRFRATMDALPGGGLLYLYFDTGEIDRLIERLGIVAESSEDYTRRIEAIGLAVEPPSRDGVVNAEFFFLTESPGR